MPLLEVDGSTTTKDHCCSRQATLFWIREELYAGDVQTLCAFLWPAEICVKQLAEGQHPNMCKADNMALIGLTSNAAECR